MREKEYYEDYTIGEEIVCPARRTITETDIVMFAAFTGDWSSLHVDAEYAKNTIFGERIAHGWLTLVVGSALQFRQGQFFVIPKSFIAFYGIDNLRFLKLVKIGDTISLEVEVADMVAKDDTRGVVSLVHRIKNQRDEEVAVYTGKILVGRKK